MEILILALVIGLIPAIIAHSKGHNFFLWYAYGVLIFIVALVHSLVLRPAPGVQEKQQIASGGRKCPHCAEIIRPEANVCRFCGRDVEPAPPAASLYAHLPSYHDPAESAGSALSAKSGAWQTPAVVAAVVVGVFLIIGVVGRYSSAASSSGSAAPMSAAEDPAASATAAADQAPVEADAQLTGPEENAVRSAKQYLSLSGFSREGLIQQLSSSAGDGYDRAVATAAVDSLGVDWNENAVKSAKQYLGLSGFSCNGLIDQLSSGSGDKYTVSQATYGAHQAGAC